MTLAYPSVSSCSLRRVEPGRGCRNDWRPVDHILAVVNDIAGATRTVAPRDPRRGVAAYRAEPRPRCRDPWHQPDLRPSQPRSEPHLPRHRGRCIDPAGSAVRGSLRVADSVYRRKSAGNDAVPGPRLSVRGTLDDHRLVRELCVLLLPAVLCGPARRHRKRLLLVDGAKHLCE